MRSDVIECLLKKIVVDFFSIAGLLFISAGSINYIAAWIFLGIFLVLAIFYCYFMIKRHPALFVKRVVIEEKDRTQVAVMCYALGMVCQCLILAGLSFRFEWPSIPLWRYIIVFPLIVTGATIYIKVIEENDFLSSAVLLEPEQSVIQSGPYRVVRHPMYSSMIILFAAAAISLGSVYALIVLPLFLPALIVRIHNEERLLLSGLAGYNEYMKKVRFRIVPYVW